MTSQERARECLFEDNGCTRPRLFSDKEYCAPAWGGSVFQKWARSYLRRNLWRAQCFYDLEDLEQEACLKYFKVVESYVLLRQSISNDRHLMAMFKQCITNMIQDHAKKKSRRIETTQFDEDFTL